MAYADIFKDESTFPDTIEVTLPNGAKATLGEIRELTRTEQRNLANQMSALQRERAEAKDLVTKAADLEARAQASLDAATRQPATPVTPDDFDADPWWEPVRKKFKSAVDPLQEALNQIQASLQAQQQATERAASIWANDRWKSQYASAKDRLKSPKYADWTFEKVRDYAASNRILDEYGFPAIDKAVGEITKEDELERIKREAYEAGQREGQVQGRLRTMNRPSSASGVKQPEKGLAADKNFEDLGDSVMSDAELTKQLAELGAIDPADIVQ